MTAEVYVMVSDELGLMKVGWSGCARTRNSQLRNGQNALRQQIPDLRVLYLIQTVSPLAVERYVHGCLDRQPGSSEWFPLDHDRIETCLDDVFGLDPECRIYSPLPQPWPQAEFGWGGVRGGAGRKPNFGKEGRAVQVTARIPRDCWEWLKDAAEANGTSLSAAAAAELVREWREA